MGVPWAIKTDNGPAYTSSSFQQFLKSWGIYHTTGIPYNPQGQGIIERTNLTLKETLQKQNDIHICLDPNLALTHVLFILNFRTFDSNGVSPAYKHWGSFPSLTPLPLVYWKDPLTGTWQGSHPLITQGWGFAYVFPKSTPNPIWIPTRNVKPGTTSQIPRIKPIGQETIPMTPSSESPQDNMGWLKGISHPSRGDITIWEP